MVHYRESFSAGLLNCLCLILLCYAIIACDTLLTTLNNFLPFCMDVTEMGVFSGLYTCFASNKTVAPGPKLKPTAENEIQCFKNKFGTRRWKVSQSLLCVLFLNNCSAGALKMVKENTSVEPFSLKRQLL